MLFFVSSTEPSTIFHYCYRFGTDDLDHKAHSCPVNGAHIVEVATCNSWPDPWPEYYSWCYLVVLRNSVNIGRMMENHFTTSRLFVGQVWFVKIIHWNWTEGNVNRGARNIIKIKMYTKIAIVRDTELQAHTQEHTHIYVLIGRLYFFYIKLGTVVIAHCFWWWSNISAVYC